MNFKTRGGLSGGTTCFVSRAMKIHQDMHLGLGSICFFTSPQKLRNSGQMPSDPKSTRGTSSVTGRPQAYQSSTCAQLLHEENEGNGGPSTTQLSAGYQWTVWGGKCRCPTNAPSVVTAVTPSYLSMLSLPVSSAPKCDVESSRHKQSLVESCALF